jgi:hypothetical protein
MNSNIEFFGQLQVDHYRNGLVIDTRITAPAIPNGPAFRDFKNSSWFRRLVNGLRGSDGRFLNRETGLVTSAGVTYLAAAFAANTNPINNFNYHACGTGTQSQGTQTLVGGSITPATPPVVTTPSNHTLTTNDIVNIAGVTGGTNPNGEWQILVLSLTTFSLQNFAASGTQTISSATYQRTNGAGDTVLVAENDNGSGGTTRITGTQTSSGAGTPASPAIYQSVSGSFAMTGSAAIVEWGLLSAASSGTLWDRRWLNTANAPSVSQAASATALSASPINVVNGDSIVFTYKLTCTQGGS